jgi:hypothetical protein
VNTFRCGDTRPFPDPVLNRIDLPDELGRGHHGVRAVVHERQACAVSGRDGLRRELRDVPEHVFQFPLPVAQG